VPMHGRAPKEDRRQDPGEERRAATASSDRRDPGPRPRGGQGGPGQCSPRGRAGRGRCRLGPLPSCPAPPHRGGCAAGGRPHGVRRGRGAPPRLRALLLHPEGRAAAGGV
ncbi:MAG: hypothetical protein AVDCRST_MAG03-1580, partial [uncultured Rubrobacteraceae bacterium]